MPLANSPRELPASDMIALALGLDCIVGYLAKVKGRERYDYFLGKPALSDADSRLLESYGLKVLE